MPAPSRAQAGPTLPALLRRRFGIPVWATVAVVVALGLAGAAAVAIGLSKPAAPGRKVVHHGRPTFNLLYPPAKIHRARPQAGELLRLQGRRGKLVVEVVVRPLALPAYGGDITHGLVPVHADRLIDAQRRATPGFHQTYEGRARFNDAVGYEFDFQSVSPSGRLYGRDALLVPDDPAAAHGGYARLSLRQRKAGGAFTPAERNLAYTSKKVFRSFHFGTGRR